MRTLTKMKVINWQFFNDQELHFNGKSMLITGGTGAGKSTMIDALQVLLVGDLRTIKFNPSAHDQHTDRNIVTYLRGKIGAEEREFKRGNKDFTSYITMEIYLDQSKKSIIVGAVFDFNAASKRENHSFFKIEDCSIQNDLFYKEKNMPFTQEEFYNHLKQSGYKYKAYKGDVQGYLEDLRQILGKVKNSFFSLIQKGIAFKNISNIRSFIYDYILDDDPIDSEALRDNFEKVKNMEDLIYKIEKEIHSLEHIENKWKEISTIKRTILANRYIVKKSAYLGVQDRLLEAENNLQHTMEYKNKIREEIEQLSKKEQELYDDITNLFIEISNHDITRRSQNIKDQLKTLEIEVNDLVKEKKRVTGYISKEIKENQEVIRLLQKYSEQSIIIEPLHASLADWQDILHQDVEVFPDNLVEVNDRWKNVIGWYYDTKASLNQEKEERMTKIQVTKSTIAELEKNEVIPSYHPSRIFQQLLQENLYTMDHTQVSVDIVCEVIDIPNEKWKNAIEGYLKSQKFYLIIPPAYYDQALELYDEYKFTHKISGVGIVNIQPILEKNHKPYEHSLSEEVVSDNLYAKRYCDYLLGRLIKCDDIHELKNYRSSITSSCMLYKDYTVRHLPKKDYATPYIGQQAIQIQLQQKNIELSEYIVGLNEFNEKLKELQIFEKLRPDKGELYQGWFESWEQFVSIEDKKNNIVQIQQDIILLDTKEVDLLVVKKENLEEERKHTNQTFGLKQQEFGRLNTKEEQLKNSIQSLQFNQQVKEKEYVEYKNAMNEQILEECEKRWDGRNQDKNNEEIEYIYTNNVSSMETRKENLMRPFIKIRAEFNEQFYFGGDPIEDSNEEYDHRLQFIKETKLVDYKEQAEEKKKNAYYSFQNDFINKLRERITEARDGFNALNFSLKKLDFGGDQYTFKIFPKQEMIEYYEMVMDNDLFYGGLFNETFQDKHGDSLNELFKYIALEQDSFTKQNEFLDYRTYLDFEIEIKDKNGGISKFSKIALSKSGGETQVPFYIAVLASFYHTYQMYRKNADTFRLVIFDEAFNRMDTERVEKCIRYIKDCGFQAIVVAPTTSIDVMAPLFPITSMVISQNYNSFIEQIEKENWGKMLELFKEEEDITMIEGEMVVVNE